jgi:hypothetical protein
LSGYYFLRNHPVDPARYKFFVLRAGHVELHALNRSLERQWARHHILRLRFAV